MIGEATRKYKHVCPRNCASSCTLFSSVKNDRLLRITGDHTHPYTGGKLCAKGFTYKELNEHPTRLKYPLYQKRKGSGKFAPISWEKAYEIILSQMQKIEEKYHSFQSLAYYKGSGNIGVHHNVTDEFFSSLGGTKIVGISSMLNQREDSENLDSFDVSKLLNSSLIVIWGANPAATNIHLMPYLISAQIRGAKIIVIDPIRTKTANLADLWIPLQPNSDQILIQLLTLESTLHGDFSKSMQPLERDDLLEQCNIAADKFQFFLQWLLEAESISYILGSGLQKHHGGMETIQAIKTFVHIQGELLPKGTRILMKNWNRPLFHNQVQEVERSISTNELPAQENGIDMLWITGGNPLIQEKHPAIFKDWMDRIPFVVTVDHFLTPTASMSNLVLPTTTFFEELDIIISPWHNTVALNEKALTPFCDSRSEWRILTDMARQTRSFSKVPCSFPIYSDEEEYLNAQFNERVEENYSIRSLQDLREKDGLARSFSLHLRADRKGPFHFQFQNRSGPLKASEEYPFWLLTPHDPYRLNSQFHYLNLSNEKEPTLALNPDAAQELKIKDGEIITLYNEHAAIEIKAVYNPQLPTHIVLFYQGWYPESGITINDLMGDGEAQGMALYDTFVNVRKY